MKTSATAAALIEALQSIARNRPSDRNIVLLCQAGDRYIQEVESRLAALEGRDSNASDGATSTIRGAGPFRLDS